MDRQRAIELILLELDDAQDKHPTWPVDPVHASAVLNEEAGELTQACLQYAYEGKIAKAHMSLEAAQVGAMAVRFLMGMSGYERTKN